MSSSSGTARYSFGSYDIGAATAIMTPSLLIYRDLVQSNINTTVRLLGGEPNRWRPHVKTAKLQYVIKMLVASGVNAFKCATSLELLSVICAGGRDVLIAYPLIGANAQRVRALAAQYPEVKISVLIDSAVQIEQWRDSPVSVFADVNPGMNRTGIEQARIAEIFALVQHLAKANIEFQGLHYYDGHLGHLALHERTNAAHAGYDQLLAIISSLRTNGTTVKEVITAGTPTFPCTLSYKGFLQHEFLHRASPGTVVYCDATSFQQLPSEYDYVPAAVVLSRVVSRPTSNRITCDAGHKTVSADAGIPNCVVIGQTTLIPQVPSEEHLPMHIPEGTSPPAIGDLLYLIPRHVCPTVNNFDHALIIEGFKIVAVEPVSARGREVPFHM